jgi:hypothetical protein
MFVSLNRLPAESTLTISVSLAYLGLAIFSPLNKVIVASVGYVFQGVGHEAKTAQLLKVAFVDVFLEQVEVVGCGICHG